MPPDATALTAAERLVRRDRLIVVTGLFLLCGLSWLWLIGGAGMGMSALEMTRTGLFPHLGVTLKPMAMTPPLLSGALGEFVLMSSGGWVVMSALMLPSAAPMMLLYAGTVRFARNKGRMSAPPATTCFLAGYLTAWLGFSMAAVLIQTALVTSGTLSAMMLWSTSPWLSAAVLALAALYQVTPLKRACLEHCRSPAHYLSRHWRPGAAGGFRMGLEHGAYCLGCCWVLMLLLFVGGVMNLIWIAALAIFVLIEKLGIPGLRSGVFSAALLAAWAIATIIVSA
jgi:predicted metal-binding membrane protein